MPLLARAICSTIDQDVPFRFGCFATTDPATGLISWAYKSHPLEVGDEEFAAAEYGPPDLNQFAELARRSPPFGVLSSDTEGHPEHCRRFRTFLAPRFGFTDELRVVFLAGGASWGVLALYRGPDDQPFSPAEGRQLGGVSELVANAIQRTLFMTDPSDGTSSRGPAVLILDGNDKIRDLTTAARQEVEELGGWEAGSLPTSVLAVAATARTSSAHAKTLVRSQSGRWLTLRAGALDEPHEQGSVVVIIDAAPVADLGPLALAARGLTAREQEVASLVLQGVATPAIAAALHLSPHTVQDHLKTIFAKIGVNSRREMVARFVLG
jgi:DNA-binding CsgD family transcriptional regulator